MSPHRFLLAEREGKGGEAALARASPLCRRNGPLFPAEVILRVDELSYTCGARGLRVDFLVANHRRCGEVNAVDRGKFGDHPAFGLAAFASVGVIMRAYLPRCENSAELAIEVRDRRLDLRESEPSALHPGLDREAEGELVAHCFDLFSDA